MHPFPPDLSSKAEVAVAATLLVTLFLAFVWILGALRRRWRHRHPGGLDLEGIRWTWAEILFSFALYFSVSAALFFLVFGLLASLLAAWAGAEFPEAARVDLKVVEFGAVPDVRRDPVLLGYLVHISSGLLTIAGVCFVVKQLSQSSTAALGFQRLPGWRDGFAVLLLFACLFFPICFLAPLWILVLEFFGHVHELQDAVASFFFAVRHGDLVAVAGTVVGAVVVAPVVEELLYRGLLHGYLSKKFGFAAAATVSALIFSAAHMNLGVSLPIFVLGLILAAVYERRGSLYDAILFHALFNASSLAQAVVEVVRS